MSSLLGQGIRAEDEARLSASLHDVDSEEGLHVIREELEETRGRRDDLAAQLATLQDLLKVSRDWIGLDDRHFQDALASSLHLLGTDGLRPQDPDAALRDPATARWEIPALHQRVGADPTWAATLDSLRAPAKQKQKLWEWRKEAPIRPVVFRDPGTLDGEVVHLHLEHRLVRRLLGRFLAQGFLHHELTRACIVRTDDPVPRVLALGRLSLYGEGASRLHDQIVDVAAEWTDPSQRGRAKLKPPRPRRMTSGASWRTPSPAPASARSPTASATACEAPPPRTWTSWPAPWSAARTSSASRPAVSAQ